MSPSLMDKLRMMDTMQKSIPNPDASSLDTEGVSWSTDEPCADDAAASDPFHLKKEAFPLSLLGDRRFATPVHLASIFGLSLPHDITEKDMIFLDTETTGLSGGAGTLAFQIGLGYCEGGQFIVEQFCMRDYHEEAAMLCETAARLRRCKLLVSFNGRAFDVPLLRSRFLMVRQKEDAIPRFHADVLFPARRLWKLRLQNCRLSHLEEALLGIRREDDLPGALVPQTYFQYLKNRDFSPVERIMRHNQQDIVSLAQLFFFLCREYACPEQVVHGADLLSLAKHYARTGQASQSTKCYRLCAGKDTRPQAFHALAVCEKKGGRADNAIRLYSAMLRRGEEPVMACEALAKLYEHQKKNLDCALQYTRQALLLLSEPTLLPSPTVQEARIALQCRYARLQRKQRKKSETTNK